MSKIGLIILLLFVSKVEAQTSALAVSDSLYAVGEYDKAIKELKKISPKTEKIHLKLAKNYAANRETEAAIFQYKKVLENSPNRVLTAVSYGRILAEAGQLKKADSVFSALAKQYPKNARFQYQLGLIKEKQKDSTAIHHFMFTITLDKGHQGALYKVAKNKLKNRQYTMAEHFSKMGLEVNPKNPSLLSILAQTYSSLKLYKEAIPHYEKLIELGQESAFIYTKLGFAYYRESNYKGAIKMYKNALKIENHNSDTHYTLGKLYALTGDLDKSETHFLMAILMKNQPVDAEFLSLALTYKMQEKDKEALEYFNKALAENPENERALYERAVAADNYYKDDKAAISYYQDYLNKYENIGNAGMLSRAKNRISDLKKKMHLAEN